MRSRAGKNPNYRPATQPRPAQIRPNTSRSSVKKDNKKETTKKSRCARLLLSIVGSIMVMLVVAILMPSKIDPVEFQLPPRTEFSGPLTPNDALKATDRMFDHLIKGPEGIAIDKDGNIYTGTLNGKIMRIDMDGGMKEFASLGRANCSSFPTCGRPLGMRIDPTNEFLYVADAYLGLFKINLKSGKSEKVFPFSDSFKVTLFNDLEFLPNGDIVISESSDKFYLYELGKELMESRERGRLILVSKNDEGKKFSILYHGIGFSNGVQLDLRDKESVLVAETTRDRILRVFVNGSRKGEAEVFATLPGMPDNIRATEAGDGYWVGMAIVRGIDVGGGLRDMMKERPYIRSAISKILPGPLVLHFARTRYGLAVKLDLDGRIVGSLHDPSGKVVHDVAQVTESGGALYLSNYDSTYIGRLDQSCKAKSSCRFQRDPKAGVDDGKKKKEL